MRNRGESTEQLGLDLCQRWRHRRESYRPGGEVIDPSQYGVELLSETAARAFLATHHYAGEDSYPSTQVRVGLFRCVGFMRTELVGAMVFGVPSSSKSLTRWAPAVDAVAGTVLQRLALLDDVPGNGETWFLRRGFGALRSERREVRVVLSYSDPVARADVEGRIYKPGHIGRIYRAHNGIYLGRTRRDDTYLLPSGEIIAPRSMSKLRNSERGGKRLEEKLVAKGAPARLPGESDREYAYRLVRDDLFVRRRRRPGNHVYAWPLTHDRRERRLLLAQWTPKPPPTEPDPVILGPVGFAAFPRAVA